MKLADFAVAIASVKRFCSAVCPSFSLDSTHSIDLKSTSQVKSQSHKSKCVECNSED